MTNVESIARTYLGLVHLLDDLGAHHERHPQLEEVRLPEDRQLFGLICIA